MSHSQSIGDRFLSAERLLEEFLVKREQGDDADFESLIRTHPELEPELREMHAAAAEVDGALRNGRALHSAEQAHVADMLKQLGDGTVGSSRYVLEGEVGKGGMGVVFRVRDTKLDRPLAMKVILGQADIVRTGKTPPIARRQLTRFVNEAKITSQLDHPGIVPVHEIGVDADGRAYFTMKLVQGITLAEVFMRRTVNEPEWSMLRVLSIIQRVCEAMAFAHDRGVIHRDLKPLNIMVGAFGEVYVMDWGLARRLDDAEELRSASAEIDARFDTQVTLTRDGSVIGTPAYMSPEQARGEIALMDARADVYAIGAMLYELLAGHPPYVRTGERCTAAEVLARIVTTSPDRVDARAMPSELAAICDRAMDRERERRYANLREMSDDLQRFVDGRTVRAFRTGTWAETKKWVQRNKQLSGALLCVLIVATVGASAFAWKAREARESAVVANAQAQLAFTRANALESALRDVELSREQAEASRNDANNEKLAAQAKEQETRFVADHEARVMTRLTPDTLGHTIMLEVASSVQATMERAGRTPDEIGSAQSTLGDVLRSSNATTVAMRVIERAIFEPAVLETEREYGRRPLLGAMLLTSLAERLRTLGIYDLGERAARSAVRVRRARLGDDAPDTLASISGLALLLQRRGSFVEAEALCREVLETTRCIRGNNDLATVNAINSLASVILAQDRLDAAEPLCNEAMAIVCQRESESYHASNLEALRNLASLRQQRGRSAEAQYLYQEILDRNRAWLGPTDPATLDSITPVATLLALQGRSSDAEALYLDALNGYRAAFGDDNPATALAASNLAGFLMVNNRLDEAAPLCYEALAVARSRLGDNHPSTLAYLSNLGFLLQAQHRYSDAETPMRDVLANRRATLGNEHLSTITSVNNLAAVLHFQGRLAEAEPLYREALVGFERRLGPDSAATIKCKSNLASTLMVPGKWDESVRLYEEVIEARRSALGDNHRETQATRQKLLEVLEYMQTSDINPERERTITLLRSKLNNRK